MKPGWVTGLAAAATIAGAALVLLFLANGEGSATQITTDPLNGSGQYAPAVIGLFVFAGLMSQRRTPHWQWVWGATGAFLLALAFRRLDAPLCPTFPLGTHFMRHILNGGLVAWLLQILILGISDVEHPSV